MVGVSMLQSFFSSKTRIRLLRFFINNPHRPYYLREISKLLGEPLTPLRRELINLKRVGFLKNARIANLVYYDVNDHFLFYQELKSMIEKVEQVEPAYQGALCPGMAGGEVAR